MPTKLFFFSIIIPAHNEEEYISDTLQNIQKLDYPAEYFETIIIENGSTDKTFAVIKEFEKGNTSIFSFPQKGVSTAKNIGIEKRSLTSNWTIFLDADTVLKMNFLRDLNDYLQENITNNISVGTTEIQPISNCCNARAWFAFYDFGHRLTKASCSIQVVKSSVVSNFRFDEKMTIGEDLELIRAARMAGKFFFFSTKDVYPSIRRFEREGWWKVFFYWTIVAMLPARIKRCFDYKVVR